jgi:hypothetical protein
MKRLLVPIGLAMFTAAASAFTPGHDHSLMNASSGRIVLDIRSSGGKPISHYRLAPGYSVGFDGVFSYLRVQMPSGKSFIFSEQQLATLHGGTRPDSGAWLVDDSGVRCVSLRDYNRASRRFDHKWP